MTDENIKVMNDTVTNIKKMLVSRQSKKTEALKAFEGPILDNLPDTVKISREQEASKLRAALYEINDLLDIINFMYPSA